MIANHVLIYWLFVAIGCIAIGVLVALIWQVIREWWG